MMQVESPSLIVSAYLSAFYSGDFDRARTVVDDMFTFEGPFLKTSGKDPFFKGAEGLRTIVNGQRTLRQWIDGNEVCTLHTVTLETVIGSAEIVMSEWHTVNRGKIVAGNLVFDTAAFRAIVLTGT